MFEMFLLGRSQSIKLITSLYPSLSLSLNPTGQSPLRFLHFLPTVADCLLIREMSGRCKYINQGVSHEMTFVVNCGIGSQVISLFFFWWHWRMMSSCHCWVGSQNGYTLHFFKKKNKMTIGSSETHYASNIKLRSIPVVNHHDFICYTWG